MNPSQQSPQPNSVAGQPRPTMRPLPTITPEMEAKHQQSKAKYPNLSLSAGEYVIQEVRRHPIGILSIWIITGFLVVAVMAGLWLYAANQEYIASLLMLGPHVLPSGVVMAVPALILSAFFVLGGVIATVVYEGNKFYITNESVVQFIQPSLFNTKQQVVNLINVEDASSQQANLIEQLLNYGTIHLSTQGEQTHYTFRFVANPKSVVHAINDASERAVKVLQGFPLSEF